MSARQLPVAVPALTRLLRTYLGAIALSSPAPLLASAVLLPAGDVSLREDLNRLADRGVISLSLSTWPLPEAAVSAALTRVDADKLAGADAAAYSRVRRALDGADINLRAAVRTDEYQLPRGFQSESRARSEFGTQAALSSSSLTLSLGLNHIDRLTPGEHGEFTLDGSYASWQVLGQIASISQIDRWWGPSDQGGAILGSAARPFPALSVQRATQTVPGFSWLRWMGPWNYQVFLGQLRDYEQVPQAKLFGVRLSIKPFDVIDVGINRTMQWGGRGRPESLDSFWDSWIGESNTDDPDDSDDPANQLAGFDVRITPFGGRLPLALFAEYIGEDETAAHHWPAKTFGTVGFEWRFEVGRHGLLWRFEHADTTADGLFNSNRKPDVTYTNSAYPGGYYQHGLSLGYPIGGDGELDTTSLIGTSAQGVRYEARLLHMRVNKSSQAINLAYPGRDTIEAGIFKISAPLGLLRIEAVAAIQDSERHGADLVGNLNLTLELRRKE